MGRYVGWDEKKIAVVCKMMGYTIFVKVSEKGWYWLSLSRF